MIKLIRDLLRMVLIPIPGIGYCIIQEMIEEKIEKVKEK